MEEKKEIKNGYEYAHLRICKHNLQKETCRDCLFEALCNLEDNKKQDARIQGS